MRPRIAIPMPHSTDLEYGARAIPQYEHAVEITGGEPVRIPLDQSTTEVKRLVESCDGVLLPGSNADVDPAKFGQEKSTHTAAADLRREDVDFLLLEHAYGDGKPVLGICYGLQSLNVFRGGSLVQHIPDFLPEDKRAKVNHEAGKKVAVAHEVEIDRGSLLAGIVGGLQQGSVSVEVSPSREAQFNRNKNVNSQTNREGHEFTRAVSAATNAPALAAEGDGIVIPVNSSHHQSADTAGKGLRVVARCPDDGIIEAMESTSRDHFVVAVQWHPERSVDEDEASRRIFSALIESAQALKGRKF